ncbi:hypothetical protein GHK86_07875 [Acidimicrobiaceae bacterium USS-CC1]|uniref:Uncharacterized protein n=1 Tax=Acidiferrimicrobium australe TaxID=2664430 RepID=A0ABW9QTK6_9ACTN|nr:hypothetical protein [Acidiferrimicrobium australe]
MRAGDREAMVMRVLGPGGDEVVVVRGSRQRQLVAQHRAAVEGVLAGRVDPVRLERFRGKTVGGVELETDVDRLAVLFELGRMNGGPYPEVFVR